MKIKDDYLEKHIALYKNCKNPKRKKVLYLQIIETSIVIVKKIANVIAFQTGVNKDDLLQIGSVGLLKAINAFNPNKNAGFITYATYVIKGEIWHYLRDKNQMIKPPRELQEILSKINPTLKKLKNSGINDPTIAELADALNLSVDKLHEAFDIVKYNRVVSLEDYVNQDNEYTPIEAILLDKDEDPSIYENKIIVMSAMEKLPKELRDIVELTYYGDMTQREIAKKLNISLMKVSRSLKKALNMLHKIIVTENQKGE